MEISKITWILCDGCGKWRQVPQSLVDSLSEESQWFCSMNPDENFNSCDAPQELTDQEIDKNTSQVNGHGGAGEKTLRPAVWQHVSENIFLHRGRKFEHEDEIMVCQCKRPYDGSMGCGDSCLNRMLNVECNPDYCPCGEQCSNTQFSKKRYSDIESRRAGPKGFGLFTNQKLSAGDFIIEYVGEVLSEEEYMRRKLFYQMSGQRHYYFMNVGNGEVIDACRKGALGRFINHSCEPNCETQKWVVHGELAIGLFAIKDVEAGTELTFDYNFERYGDKALRCHCNSKNCRGFIGGTAEENHMAQEEDAADASLDPEPIMIEEEEAFNNPACQAILAEEVGLAFTDFQDDRLRKGYEELAAKYGVSLEWQGLGSNQSLSQPADSAEESKTQNGVPSQNESPPNPQLLEVVEQKIKNHAVQRAQKLASSKSVATVERRSLAKKSNSLLSFHSPTDPLSIENNVQSQLAPSRIRGSQGKMARRRSEVDRRLDAMLAPSGKLREMNTNSVIKMLRLFNLCDLGTASLQSSQAPKASNSEASSRSVGGTFSGGGIQHGNGTRSLNTFNSDASKEELIEHRSKRFKTEDEICSLRSKSPVKSSRQGMEPGQIEHEIRNMINSPRNSLEAGQLSARQRARMADLSLLLDVILKTSSSSNLRVFCQTGILRQLQSVLARCQGSAFSVIIKKLLRAVDHLPLSSNDMHQHTSAHGSFADTLWVLGKHSDYEIRTKARTLRDKLPLESCSKEVQASAAIYTPQRSQILNPRHRSEGKGDFNGTPNGRWKSDKSHKGPRISRWQDGHNPGWETPYERQNRGRDSSQRPNISISRDGIVSQSLPQPSIPPSPANNAFDRRGPEGDQSWRNLHRLHHSSSTPYNQSGSDWQTNFHPSHSVPFNGRSRPPPPQNPQQLQNPNHPGLGQAGNGYFQQNTPHRFNIPQLAIPDVYHNFGMDNLSASNRPPVPTNDSKIPESEETPRPPLPSGPPPPIPSSSEKNPNFERSNPLSKTTREIGESMRKNYTQNSLKSPDSPKSGMSEGAYLDDESSDDSRGTKENQRFTSHNEAKLGSKWKPPYQSLSTPLPLQASVQKVTQTQSLGFKKVTNSSQGIEKAIQDVSGPSQPSLNGNNEKEREESGKGGGINGGKIHEVPTPKLASPPPHIDADSHEGSPGSDGAKSWNKPDERFEDFVEKIIKHRLKKNQQPGHPNRISEAESWELFLKSKRAIIDAEKKAYEDRQRAHAFKAIDANKVEQRIKDYVRDLIRRLYDRKHSKSSRR